MQPPLTPRGYHASAAYVSAITCTVFQQLAPIKNFNHYIVSTLNPMKSKKSTIFVGKLFTHKLCSFSLTSRAPLSRNELTFSLEGEQGGGGRLGNELIQLSLSVLQQYFTYLTSTQIVPECKCLLYTPLPSVGGSGRGHSG